MKVSMEIMNIRSRSVRLFVRCLSYAEGRRDDLNGLVSRGIVALIVCDKRPVFSKDGV